jgi:hypothetical protein
MVCKYIKNGNHIKFKYGAHSSPKGLGWCPHCLSVGVVKKGYDGLLYKIALRYDSSKKHKHKCWKRYKPRTNKTKYSKLRFNKLLQVSDINLHPKKPTKTKHTKTSTHIISKYAYDPKYMFNPKTLRYVSIHGSIGKQFMARLKKQQSKHTFS